MKTCLFIEDTPAGLKTKFVWQASGHMDHPAESIAMNVMANLTLFIRDMEDKKLIRLAKDEQGRPGEPPSAALG